MLSEDIMALKEGDLVTVLNEFTVRYEGFSYLTGEFVFEPGVAGHIKNIWPSHHDGAWQDYRFRIVLPISEKVSVIIPQDGREMQEHFENIS